MVTIGRVPLAGAFIFAFFPFSLHAQSSECRTAMLPDGSPALFCKDKNGNWKQQEGKVSISPVAPVVSDQHLYADASYRGPAVYSVPIQQRQRRNPTLGDLLSSAIAPQTNKVEILVSVTMRIDGGSVSGSITGGAWTNKVPFTGVRKNGICDISASLMGESIVYVGKCDASGFRGTMTNYPARGSATSGTFNLGVISFVDTSERDNRRADLKMQCDSGSNTACVELDRLK